MSASCVCRCKVHAFEYIAARSGRVVDVVVVFARVLTGQHVHGDGGFHKVAQCACVISGVLSVGIGNEQSAHRSAGARIRFDAAMVEVKRERERYSVQHIYVYISNVFIYVCWSMRRACGAELASTWSLAGRRAATAAMRYFMNAGLGGWSAGRLLVRCKACNGVCLCVRCRCAAATQFCERCRRRRRVLNRPRLSTAGLRTGAQAGRSIGIMCAVLQRTHTHIRHIQVTVSTGHSDSAQPACMCVCVCLRSTVYSRSVT